MSTSIPSLPNAIAIVGMSCRFPGARNPEEFWRNLCGGVESITWFDERELRESGIGERDMKDPRYVRAGTVIEDSERFDAPFFDFSAREAEVLDPQHRVFLECAWEALENAGHVPERFQGSVGVFGGSSLSAYLLMNIGGRFHPYTAKDPAAVMQLAIGNEPDYLVTQVSYKLDLHGPSVAVQTACSTSLVAVHMAVQSLLSRECDLALAGGVTLRVPQKQGYFYMEDGPISPDGHCRPFDASSAGAVFGQGCGVVVLRRLEDALRDGDNIRAVLLGTAINNDGSLKVTFTAPSVDGQAAVITEALAVAGVDPASISYVEAHGTATPIGDPIEVSALSKAFEGAAAKGARCGLGSVKSNIGHTETAAGIAGLIKTVLALEHQELPPTLHFHELNPRIDFRGTPFYVCNALTPWTRNGEPRRAGVSSFGFGGTNAHVVLEEAPERQSPPARPHELLVLSARTPAALEAATDNLARHLTENPGLNLGDVAHTLRTGRREFPHRRVLAASSVADAAEALSRRDAERVFTHRRPEGRPSTVFLFPGGGAQYPGMGRGLYESEPVFREHVDACSRILQAELGHDLRERLYGSGSDGLSDTMDALPALFVTEYALAMLWMSRGLRPDAMLGHSLGEYVAATVSGVLTVEDALKLVAARGRWISALPAGAMMAVPMPTDELVPLLGGLEIAAINGPRLVIVSGPRPAVEALGERLVARGVESKVLPLRAAGHSAMVEPLRGKLRDLAATLRLGSPRIPYISNVTGTWIREDQVRNPEYWADHLRSTVRFSDGLATLLTEPRLFVEVGPGHGLSSLVRQQPKASAALASIPSLRHPRDEQPDERVALTAVGRAWALGAPVSWDEVEGRKRVQLPTYPFERRRYWIDPLPKATGVTLEKRASADEWLYVPGWKQAPLVATAKQAGRGARRWLVIDGGSGLGEALAKHVRERGDSCSVLPSVDEQTLGAALAEGADVVVHCGNAKPVNGFSEAQEAGFYGLATVGRAVAGRLGEKGAVLVAVSTGAEAVESGDRLVPEKVTAQAVCLSLGSEVPALRCAHVDVAPWQDARGLAAAARAVWSEVEAGAPARRVSWRGSQRWLPDFTQAKLPAPAAEARPRNAESVWLITGGLGDLGLLLAGHVLERYAGKVALLGRGGLPPEEGWDAWLASHGEEDRVSRRIRRVSALRERGQVLVLAAEVSDVDQMARALDRAERELGPLRGVIHAAGIIGEGTFATVSELEREHCEQHFRAKAQGLLVLDSLLGGRPLDCRMLVSSLASLTGGLGFSAYTAANLFLDGFAARAVREGRAPWLSVNWDGWKLGKAGEDDARGRTLMRFSLEPAEGLAVLDRILAVDGLEVSQLVVSPAPLELRIDARPTEDEKEGSAEPPDTRYERPELTSAYTAPASPLEAELCETWSRLLGLERVGTQDNFFELGGHSLLATQMMARVRERFGVQAQLKDLFRAPTVAGLAALVLERGGGAAAKPPEAPAPAQALPAPRRPEAIERWEPFPLTDVQYAYWIGRNDLFELGNVACHFYMELDCTDLDLERYEKAWRRVIERHDMLRAVMLPDGLQMVHPEVPPFEIGLEELRGLDAQEAGRRLLAIRQEMSTRNRPADAWPLFDVRASFLDDQRTRLHVDLDVLVCDAASFTIINREIKELYEHGTDRELPPLEYTFREYVLAEQAQRDSEAHQTARAYWRARLPELPPAPELPLARPPSTITRPQFVRHTAKLVRERWERLKQRAVRAGLTPTGALLAAFTDVLTAWSKSPRFTVNLTFFNRLPLHGQVNAIVGDFTTLTLLEVDNRAWKPFGERARLLQQRLWEDLDHNSYNAIHVMRDLAQERGNALAAAMPVVFTSTLGVEETLGAAEHVPYDWIGQVAYSVSQTPQVWLDHQVYDDRGDLAFNWDAVADLFPERLLEDMFSTYVEYLGRLADDEAAWGEVHPRLLPRWQSEVVAKANATAAPVPDVLLHQLFERQAAERPQAPAVITSSATFTYAQLEAASAHLAARLQASGVRPGEPVAVVMEKGWEQVAAVLGILRAGGAYLPVSPELPRERVWYLLENGGVRQALTQPDVESRLEWPDAVSRLVVAEDSLTAGGRPLPGDVGPGTLAYIIYTSGSTGFPKGVMIDHRGAVNTVVDINQRFGVGPEARVLAVSSLSFDLSVYDIFGLLAAGGAIVMPDATGTRDPAHWNALMREAGVTLWNSAPPLMEMLVEHVELSEQPLGGALCTALLSGDWIPVSLPERIRARASGCEVVSLGGATEASIWSIFFPIHEVHPDWRSIPYGKPMLNQTFHVLDEALEPRPMFVPGQLFIGGVGLAQGYWKDEARTRASFLTHPRTGERLYRTGDLGRYLPDGNIEFLGREDSQVKIHGHRIELGEIEAALQRNPEIGACAVLAMDDARGVKRLVGYVTPHLERAGTVFEVDREPLFGGTAWEPLVEAGRKQAEPEASLEPEATAFDELAQHLDRLTVAALCVALKQLGLFRQPRERHTLEGILQLGGVAPAYRKWLRRCLLLLADMGLLRLRGDHFENPEPLPFDSVAPVAARAEEVAGTRFSAEVGYYRRAAEALGDLLSGQKHGGDLLFRDGESEQAERFYQRFFQPSNEITRALMRAAVAALPEGRPLRVLEVGAGVGSATAYLVPELPASRTKYVYTDLSRYFWDVGRKRFADYSFIDYGILDIERSPREQGYESHSFDIIVASGVLHATRRIEDTVRNLRSLLASDGLVLLIEQTNFRPFFNLAIVGQVRGSEEGFDRFEDHELRPVHGLLSASQWREVLARNGFPACETFLKPDSVAEVLGYTAIAARGPARTTRFRPARLRELLAGQLPEYMVPSELIALEHLPLNANGKLDRKALPVPESSASTQTAYRPPETGTQRKLAALWQEVLGVERVGLDDHFIRLGGDSLLAVRLGNRLRETFGVQLPLRALFDAGTLEKLAKRLDESTEQGSPVVEEPKLPVLVPAPGDLHVPFSLSDLQQAYWVGQQSLYELSYSSAHFYIDMVVDHVDLARLDEALQRLIAHQPMLRCVMLPDGTQRVLPEVPRYPLTVVDLRGGSEEKRQSVRDATREEMVTHGPATDRWPLFDLRVHRLGEQTLRLHLSCSLLIADGWSFYIFFHELFRFYREGAASLPPLEVTFRDYIQGLAGLRHSPQYERSFAYWRERLPSLPAAPQLPLAKEPSALERPRIVRRTGLLEPAAWETFQARAAERGLTASAALCNVYAQVLAAWSRSSHFTLNLLYFNRLPLHPQVDRILGPFSTTNLLEVDVGGSGSFKDHAARIQQQLGTDLAHSYVSGIQVLRELARQEGGAARALMPVVFSSTVGFDSEYMRIPADEVRFSEIHERVQTPQVWIDHQVYEEDGALGFNWDAVEELFPAGMVDAMYESYRELLGRLVRDPAAWDERVRALVPGSQLLERQRANSRTAPVPETRLERLFLERARERPDRLAVLNGNTALSYGELEERARAVAHELLGRGVSSGQLVAVVMDKGWEQVVAVLGVLMAGGAYLPVDPNVPAQRLAYLLGNGGVRVALTQERWRSTATWPEGVAVVPVGRSSPAPRDEELPVRGSPDDLAYVIYTSGSTGSPKGVMVTHRAAVNTVVDINHRWEVGEKDRTLALSALNFDLSVYDVFGLLAAGGAVVVPEPGDARDPARWVELMRRYHVTLWNTVPALMQLLVDHLKESGEAAPEGLGTVLLSGDWIPVGLPDRIRACFPRSRVVSLGGATEAAIWSIAYPIDRVDPAWKSIPYGKPLTNQTFHVLDANLEPRPVWVPGELFIGGAGVALGYFADPGRTAERFPTHPRTGERLYRTGDLGRYLPDGNLEFLGREDNQVKVQGHRIELGEVEAALLTHPEVREVVAVAQGEAPGPRRLAAFVTLSQAPHAGFLEALRRHVQGLLPEYMVPAHLEVIPSIPLTSNGKVDRSRLTRATSEPRPESHVHVAPRTEREGVLAGLFEQVLGASQVGVTDDFFSLGGHSLLAVRLMAQVRQKLGVSLPLATLFRARTVERLAQAIESHP